MFLENVCNYRNVYNKGNMMDFTEANVVSVRWRIIVSYESNMYSGKGISCSSVFFVCLFVEKSKIAQSC